jgi:hypothetical protein
MKWHCLKPAFTMRSRLLTACVTAWPRNITVIYECNLHVINNTSNNGCNACNFHFFPVDPADLVTCRPFCHYRLFIGVISTIQLFNFD